MTDTTTGGAHYAHRMLGIPYTTGGLPMPEGQWFRLAPPVTVPEGVAPYVAVGKYGVYQCDSRGTADFRRRVYNCPVGATLEQALAGVGDGYVGL